MRARWPACQNVCIRPFLLTCSLVDLERSSALHSTPQFPPHTLRPGDVVALEEHGDARKGAKPGSGDQGVVYRVGESKITIAMNDRTHTRGSDDSATDFALPAVVRVTKLVNEVTFDRYVGRNCS